MTHHRIHVYVETGASQDGPSRTLAATVHLPESAYLAQSPAVMIGLPGGGYNRHYFDLDETGYSQAAHHVAKGIIVIALDHLGVGDSDIPTPALNVPQTAAANHAALQVILEQLRTGQLSTAVKPISPAAIIGMGHSMGGHIAVCMQAAHRSFDALAVLGASMVCTRLPTRLAGEEVCASSGRKSAMASILAEFDWRYAFHWEDVPEHLAGIDAAFKPSSTGPAPPWRSITTPAADGLMQPAYFAREAASIEVPVLIAMGERDVCHEPLRELSAFVSSRDLAAFVGPRMAHMHNFAGTRVMLWRRLDAFVGQAAAAAG